MLIAKIKLRFNQSDSLKNISVLAGGSVLSQSVIVAVTPILTRIYTPSEFGKLAIFMAVILVIATTVSLRYEVNILIPKDKSEAVNLVFLSIVVSVFTGLLLFAFSLGLPDIILDLLGVRLIKSWLPWACLIGMATAINTVTLAWLNRIQNYKKISQIKIIQSLVMVISSIALGIYGHVEGLIVSQIISVIVVLGIVSRQLPKITHLSLGSIRKIAKKYVQAPMYLLPTAFLDVITLQIPILFISAFYGDSEAGQFNLAWRVLILPASILGASIGQVFFQRFSSVWPDNLASWELLMKTWKMLAIAGCVPAILLIIYGENLFSALFGQNWAESGKMASILAPMLFISLLHSPTSTSSIVLGLQKPVFLLSLSILIYRPLSLWIGWKMGSINIGLSIYSLMEIIQILYFQFLVYNKIKIGVQP